MANLHFSVNYPFKYQVHRPSSVPHTTFNKGFTKEAQQCMLHLRRLRRLWGFNVRQQCTGHSLNHSSRAIKHPGDHTEKREKDHISHRTQTKSQRPLSATCQTFTFWLWNERPTPSRRTRHCSCPTSQRLASGRRRKAPPVHKLTSDQRGKIHFPPTESHKP